MPELETTETTETTETETPETETEETSETESESSGDELDPEQLAEAQNLYKALRNPQTAGPLVAALAQQAGLHLSAHPTEREEKKVTKGILDLVQEEFGDEYKFLAPKFAKALEKAFDLHTQTQEAKFEEVRAQQVENQVDVAFGKLARETKGDSKKLESRMVALSGEIPIGNQNVEKYVRRLYAIAASENQKPSTRQMTDRILRNATDAPGRLKGAQGGQETAVPGKKMSLTDAVKWAQKQIEKG